MMFLKKIWIIFIILCGITFIKCYKQMGPDPWDYSSNTKYDYKDDTPPDLKPLPIKKVSSVNKGISDWFYRRLLAIVLKGGSVQKEEDGNIITVLQMKISQEKWKIMEDFILNDSALSDDMFRTSIGYIEDSIQKPAVSDKIVMAWSEYIQFYFLEYKHYIVWSFGCTAAIFLILAVWKHMSHKLVVILVVICLYLYEVFLSYKEAEKEELDAFIRAVNTCKWKIWTSECEVPPPDPMIFIKHLNPLKIAIRMFTTLISEPMLTIHGTVKIMVEDLTDGLVYPLNKIMYGIVVLIFSLMLMYLLVLIMFNYVLNLPFNLEIPFMKIGLRQRNRNLVNNVNTTTSRDDNVDRISGDNLRQFIDIIKNSRTNGAPALSQNRRKGSTRIGNQAASIASSSKHIGNRLKIKFRPSHNGSGDA